MSKPAETGYRFAVVTQISGDNHYHEVGMKVDDQGMPAINVAITKRPEFDWHTISPETAITVLTPAWRLGEILVMDNRYDRTVPDGRKPSKWFIEVEEFDNIQDAAKRAYEVTQ